MDSYGVAVRSGAITPQITDEEYFRQAAGLPPLSAEGRAAWARDNGTRRPITLTQPGSDKVGIAPPSDASTEDEEAEQLAAA